MSSYLRNTVHPDTGKFEPAAWIDDELGRHHYGVIFLDGKLFDPRVYELTTDDKPVKANWDDFFPQELEAAKRAAGIK